jgi:hypothetical protein
MIGKRSFTGPSPEQALESLADQLRDGALNTLIALQDAASALARDIVAGERNDVSLAADLVCLAQTATAQLQELTGSLRRLVDDIANRARDAH